MNPLRLMQSDRSGASRTSELPVTNLAERAAQIYGSRGPSTNDGMTTKRSSNAKPVEQPAVDRPVSPTMPPYAEEFFHGLLNIKPERVETTSEDGTIKVTYNYHKPFYAYIQNFSGQGNSVSTYPMIKDQINLVKWCQKKLAGSVNPYMPGQTRNTSLAPEYGLKFGLNQTLICLMSMDYSVKEWMQGLLMSGQESEDERAFQM